MMWGETMKYIAACSGGKDSVATILLALEHGEPLDEVVYYEVMFSPEISGEVPEHRDFVVNVLRPYVEDIAGIKFVHLKSKHTYSELFQRPVTRGKNVGKIRGYPYPGGCYVNRDCKLPPIKEYLRETGDEYTQYIGIAADETDRLLRLRGTNRVSLLEKYGVAGSEARQLCEKFRLLSPTYNWCKRNGCWFCPYCSRREWAHLVIDHPILWEKLKELDGLPDKSRYCITKNMTPQQIEDDVSINGINLSFSEITKAILPTPKSHWQLAITPAATP